jgi:capsid protein
MEKAVWKQKQIDDAKRNLEIIAMYNARLRQLRQVMLSQFYQPFWNAWLDAVVKAGTLTLPGYAQNPEPYRRVDWHPPPWSELDPLRSEERIEIARKAGKAGGRGRKRKDGEA